MIRRFVARQQAEGKHIKYLVEYQVEKKTLKKCYYGKAYSGIDLDDSFELFSFRFFRGTSWNSVSPPEIKSKQSAEIPEIVSEWFFEETIVNGIKALEAGLIHDGWDVND